MIAPVELDNNYAPNVCNHQPLDAKVQEVADRAFYSLAASLVVSCCFFYATYSVFPLFYIAGLSWNLINLTRNGLTIDSKKSDDDADRTVWSLASNWVGSLGTYVHEFGHTIKVFFLHGPSWPDSKKSIDDYVDWTVWSLASNWAGSLGIYVHEFGHAIAVFFLHGIWPKITVSLFSRGSISYNAGTLTKFGELFGTRYARLIVTVAGIASSLLFSVVNFTVAEQIKKQHPWISQQLVMNSVYQIATEIFHGLNAFVVDECLSHDFIALKILGGVHPLIPIAVLSLALVCFSLYRNIWTGRE